VEQAARYKADEWEGPITEWLGDRKVTTVHEVLEHVLGLNPKKPNGSAEMRVAAILKKRLGFSKRRGRTASRAMRAGANLSTGGRNFL
jgi:hypothetical protein